MITCGLLGESSEIVIVPVSGPTASGENVIFSVQVAFTARLVPHRSFSPKLALGVIPVRFRVVLPTFFSTTCWAELVDCSNCLAKVKEFVESCAWPLAFTVKLVVTISAPVVTVTVCEPVLAFAPIVSVALSCVAEVAEMPEMVTPLPVIPIVEEPEKCVLLPVMTIGTAAPCLPLEGLIWLIEGVVAGGGTW